ncbi:methionine ABC transporter permease [Natranaerobius trueperi]|uniref:Methionine ABC transporter permease n=1 Tax=Natranaerobius trueperi TaxID=759412 RepID=A0A226C077_9FIRM|nr:methionine ABC transporter permease [Natranaerobius trueperi]OWZ84653.1 methionine ABC transporter permease [Natranaerobius trueperi]
MVDIFQQLNELLDLLLPALYETFYMVGVSITITYLLGLPLGITLVVTEKGHILECQSVQKISGTIVNIFRSTPFIILMVAIIPFTVLIVGRSIGTTAAIVPLTVASIPFAARMVESSLKEIDSGVIESAIAMGASPWQIILKVLIPEALPGLILGGTITIINLISYSAMAGVVGGGGIGTLAINYGYYRFQTDVMIATVVVLIILVQGIQAIGNFTAKKVDKRVNK